MLTKNSTLEPLGLVLKPNKLAQYPDGAELVAIGSVHNGAGTCESAPAFEVAWSVDAGSPILRAEIIPTTGYTLALIKVAAGWRYTWIDGAGTASALETPTNAYTSNVDFEVDGRINWTLARDRVWITSTTGVMVFDYLSPTSAAERAPRLAGMFSPAISAQKQYSTTPSDAGTDTSGFTLVKNWNFGTSGNISSISELAAEFDFVDLFGTYNLGGQYGTNTVAPTADLAVSGQPVDPTGSKFREFTTDSILCHVKAFTDGNDIGPASAHNGGNGSFFSKFKYPSGGSDLGKDIIWETRFRLVKPTAGHWFALWTTGIDWDQGPEMDVIEAFSAYQEYVHQLWHSDSVGAGTETYDYFSDAWDAIQATAGILPPVNYLENWHVITWRYNRDDTFEVRWDGHVAQSGTLPWRVQGTGPNAGQPTNMQFLFDMTALHTVVPDYVSFIITADNLPITTEIDYSRIWERA